MTGYDEANRWLDEHAPMWRVVYGVTRLAGPCEVEIAPASSVPFGNVRLRGEGATLREATEAAVGHVIPEPTESAHVS
jgi:hypothetical protein